MNYAFNSTRGLIFVRTYICGPSRDTIIKLAIDTGATYTLINQSRLMYVGYDPATISARVHITTASGIEFMPLIKLQRLSALGQLAEEFPVLAHTLPPSIDLDGVLGLDFFRQKNLNIDFRAGEIRVR